MTQEGLNQAQNLGAGISQAPVTLTDKCKSLRSCMASWERSVLELMLVAEFTKDQAPTENFGEAKANIMLAYRHMEDARMRIGKVIQAMDGGVSIYDKPQS